MVCEFQSLKQSIENFHHIVGDEQVVSHPGRLLVEVRRLFVHPARLLKRAN